VVVLCLRGRSILGATGFKVLEDNARSLAGADGRLCLSAVEPLLMKQFAQTGHVSAEDPLRLTEAASQVGESTHAAIDEAEAWLIGHDAVGARTSTNR
jgi:SulP family sulfate permease